MRHRLLEKDAGPVGGTGLPAEPEDDPEGRPPAGWAVDRSGRRFLPRSSRSRSI